jgi:hypothetical protein
VKGQIGRGEALPVLLASFHAEKRMLHLPELLLRPPQRGGRAGERLESLPDLEEPP